MPRDTLRKWKNCQAFWQQNKANLQTIIFSKQNSISMDSSTVNNTKAIIQNWDRIQIIKIYSNTKNLYDVRSHPANKKVQFQVLWWCWYFWRARIWRLMVYEIVIKFFWRRNGSMELNRIHLRFDKRIILSEFSTELVVISTIIYLLESLNCHKCFHFV